ncbi:hypothetical protein JCM14076_11200 [Methylosoma difficile]
MEFRFSLAAMVVSMLASYSAWSQNHDACDYSGTQTQMNICAMQDFETEDAELNRVYKGLKHSLTRQKQGVLLEEQRAWLKERDPNCKKEANEEAEGGSMWPLLFESCRATSTKARIEQLKQWKK